LRVLLEDVSEVSERQQLQPRERASSRSRAPSISSRSRHVRVRLPPLPTSLQIRSLWLTTSKAAPPAQAASQGSTSPVGSVFEAGLPPTYAYKFGSPAPTSYGSSPMNRIASVE
jgi:hypothetical protein